MRGYKVLIGFVALAAAALCFFYYASVFPQGPGTKSPPHKHNRDSNTTIPTFNLVPFTPAQRMVIALQVQSLEQFEAVKDTWLSSLWALVSQAHDPTATQTHAQKDFAIVLFARSDVLEKLTPLLPNLDELPDKSIQLFALDSKSKVEATSKLWAELYTRFPHASWFYVTSTRNHVFTKYLMDHVSKLEAKSHTAQQNPVISGRVLQYTVPTTPTSFVVLRSGYLLNNIGLVIGLLHLSSCAFSPSNVPGFEADIAVATCLQLPQTHTITLSANNNDTATPTPTTVALVDHLGIHPDKPEKMTLQDRELTNLFPAGVKYTIVEPASFSYLIPTSFFNIEPARMRITHDFQHDYFFNVKETLAKIGHSATAVEQIPLDVLRKNFPMPTIPQNLHQIWVGPKNRPQVMDTCPKANPGWNYVLFNDERVSKLKRVINQKMIDIAPQLLMKTDIWRVELIFQFGGIYLDADSLCIRPFNSLVDEFDRKNYNTLLAEAAPRHNEGYLVYESEVHRPNLIANGAFGSTQYGLATLHILRMFATTSLNDAAWIATGPMFVTRVLTQAALNYNVYPSSYFFPVHYTDYNALGHDKDKIAAIVKEKNAYTNQLWGSTFTLY